MLRLHDKMPTPKTNLLLKLVAITFSLGWSVCLPAQENTYLFLRNLGMHETAITGMDADAAGKFILTSSQGKSVKLWEADSGTLIRIFFLNTKQLKTCLVPFRLMEAP
jgi:WD40 repeat protein